LISPVVGRTSIARRACFELDVALHVETLSRHLSNQSFTISMRARARAPRIFKPIFDYPRDRREALSLSLSLSLSPFLYHLRAVYAPALHRKRGFSFKTNRITMTRHKSSSLCESRIAISNRFIDLAASHFEPYDRESEASMRKKESWNRKNKITIRYDTLIER